MKIIPYELGTFSPTQQTATPILKSDPSIFGGFRLTGYIVGGWVKGDKINGKLKPFGGDGCHGTQRHAECQCRATIETDDGAKKIYMPYQGRNDIGGYEDVLKYKFSLSSPSRCAMRYIISSRPTIPATSGSITLSASASAFCKIHRPLSCVTMFTPFAPRRERR